MYRSWSRVKLNRVNCLSGAETGFSDSRFAKEAFWQESHWAPWTIDSVVLCSLHTFLQDMGSIWEGFSSRLFAFSASLLCCIVLTHGIWWKWGCFSENCHAAEFPWPKAQQSFSWCDLVCSFELHWTKYLCSHFCDCHFALRGGTTGFGGTGFGGKISVAWLRHDERFCSRSPALCFLTCKVAGSAPFLGCRTFFESSPCWYPRRMYAARWSWMRSASWFQFQQKEASQAAEKRESPGLPVSKFYMTVVHCTFCGAIAVGIQTRNCHFALCWFPPDGLASFWNGHHFCDRERESFCTSCPSPDACPLKEALSATEQIHTNLSRPKTPCFFIVSSFIERGGINWSEHSLVQLQCPPNDLCFVFVYAVHRVLLWLSNFTFWDFCFHSDSVPFLLKYIICLW